MFAATGWRRHPESVDRRARAKCHRTSGAREQARPRGVDPRQLPAASLSVFAAAPGAFDDPPFRPSCASSGYDAPMASCATFKLRWHIMFGRAALLSHCLVTVLAALSCSASTVSSAPRSGGDGANSNATELVACPPGLSAYPEMDESAGPAATLAGLCALILAEAHDEYPDPGPRTCKELRALADGFSVLELNLAGEVRYLVVGRAHDGWHSLSRIASTFPGEHTENTFDVTNVEVRTIQHRGTLLRFETTTLVRQWSEERLDELETTDKQITVCSRSTNGQQQACFTLLTSHTWKIYALARAAQHPAALERTGAPIRNTHLTGRLTLSEDGTIRNELDYRTLKDPRDPRCYTWKHNAFDFDWVGTSSGAR